MQITEMDVEYLDHMGSDLTVVNAARVSFAKEHEVFMEGKDEKLIKYLAEHNHWSPFAHTSVQFRIKAPIFVARQLVKHQVGGVWNEVSRRYVDSEPEFWFPKEIRSRPEGSMKQGSGGIHMSNDFWLGSLKRVTYECLTAYEYAISDGVAPELARMVLPQNTMTEWYWTGSLMFFARVCKQRTDSHAQQESQEIAKLISGHMKELFPVSWEVMMK